MSNLGPVYEDDEDYSPARQNAKGITRDKGSNIIALATQKQLGLVIPTDTSGGLIKNVAYYVDYDTSFNRLTFEPLFHKHNHDINLDNDATGGSYLNMRLDNISEYAEVSMTTVVKDPISLWDVNALNGTLTYVEVGADAFHMIDTGTVTGNYITADLPGIRYQWDHKMICQFATAISDNTNILARLGMNVDRVQDTPSTSRRQMGLEGCDGHGTNYVMLNANGNSASLVVTATTMPLMPGAEKNYALVHDPATTCTVFYEGVQNAQSSTNVADDGNTDMDKLFRWGLKLPTGTNGIQQNLYWLKIIGNHKVNA